VNETSMKLTPAENGSNPLLIWDTDETPPRKTVEGMLWRAPSNANFPKFHAIGEWVEANAADIRQEFLGWVSELGKFTIHGKPLSKHMPLKNGASYWWLTLVAEKCNFTKSQQIDEVIKLIGLKSWLTTNHCKDLHLVTDIRLFC